MFCLFVYVVFCFCACEFCCFVQGVCLLVFGCFAFYPFCYVIDLGCCRFALVLLCVLFCLFRLFCVSR